MFGIHDLPLFVVSGLLLNVMPGPDSLLVMTRSATQGWRAGSAAALGIGTGTFVHIVGAALGLSAILATSAAAFTVVKLAGAAYILYLAVGMLLIKRGDKRGAGVEKPLALAPLPVFDRYPDGALMAAWIGGTFFLAVLLGYASHLKRRLMRREALA